MTLLAVFLLGLLGGLHCAGMCGGIVAALSMRAPKAAASNSASVPVAALRPANSPGGPAVAPVQWHRTAALRGSASAIAIGADVAGHRSKTSRRRVTESGRSIGAAWRSLAPARLFATGGVLAPRAVQRAFAINGGRVLTYTLLGALAGAAGSTLWLFDHVLPVQRTLFIATNAVMIAIGGWLLGARVLLDWTERGGQTLWRYIQPIAATLLHARNLRELVLAGAVWGFVPCGMVYMVLLSALGAGSAGEGALLMAAFGLGTLPNLIVLTLTGQSIARFTRRPGVRRTIAVFIMAMGALGVVRGLLFEPLTIFGLCITPATPG